MGKFNKILSRNVVSSTPSRESQTLMVMINCHSASLCWTKLPSKVPYERQILSKCSTLKTPEFGSEQAYLQTQLSLIWRHSRVTKSERIVWRYQRGNQNPHIEEEQTTPLPKEKVQKDKQQSTKHTYKTKDRVTRTPLKTGGELSCSGRVFRSCSTSDTRRVNLVTNPVISREWGNFEIYHGWKII